MNFVSSAALSALYVVVTAVALLLGLSLLALCAVVAGCAAVAGRLRGRGGRPRRMLRSAEHAGRTAL